jgi:quercetin dioxygenase-like cupin family protein
VVALPFRTQQEEKEDIMRAAIVILAMLFAVPFATRADPAMELVAGPDAVKWSPVPPSFPKGAMIAVLAGNPFQKGPYVVRLKIPANYQIPAHHHPTTENVTVISGSFHAGMGDKLDVDKGQSFAPGGFVSMPAGMNHYAWATAETVVQVHGDGPFAIVYVNPADDPSKAP